MQILKAERDIKKNTLWIVPININVFVFYLFFQKIPSFFS